MPELVPTIDLAPWWQGDDDDRVAIAQAVDGACCEVGFLAIRGHDLRPSLVARMLAVTSEFFDLPSEEKCRYGSDQRGYSPEGPDLVETFIMGPDANVWPDHPGVMREVWGEYFDAMQDLADWMVSVFALSLGQSAGGFTTGAADVMRASHYERRPGAPPPLPGQLRMSPHTDPGWCTILLADPVPGLQVLGREGRWHDVLPQPDTLLVHPGDRMAAWTGDRWRSAPHRVVPPPADQMGPARRRSIAFVHAGSY